MGGVNGPTGNRVPAMRNRDPREDRGSSWPGTTVLQGNSRRPMPEVGPGDNAQNVEMFACSDRFPRGPNYAPKSAEEINWPGKKTLQYR